MRLLYQYCFRCTHATDGSLTLPTYRAVEKHGSCQYQPQQFRTGGSQYFDILIFPYEVRDSRYKAHDQYGYCEKTNPEWPV